MKTLSESNQREREKQKFSLSNIIEEKMYKKYWENTFALQWERRGIIIITYLSLKMHYYCTNICGFSVEKIANKKWFHEIMLLYSITFALDIWIGCVGRY